MPLTPGTHVGSYEITGALGAGGMGEVYRARDATLGRDVAIKILPDRTTHDQGALARFQREAQMLAALNHPNIGAIYGLVEVGSGRGLVLEFVDGPTLADLIARAGAAIPLSDALAIARQIVDALDAAHERGIVHRDLKPANIKVTPDGTVKALDFGLAKALGADADDRDSASSHSPTITSPAALTRDGIVLGTVAYMSPEQARGRTVDKRTDIWAFGCVLFELLTGQRPFAGDTVADTMSAILSQQPDWTIVRSAPPPIHSLLKRCLEKDPKRRLRDIGDARLGLEDPAGVDVAFGAVESRPQPSWSARRIGAVTGAFAAVAATAFAAGVWVRSPAAAELSPSTVRFHVAPPPGSSFYSTVETVSLAVSPDGLQLGFVAASSGVRRIWIRPIGELEARPLSGTEDATSLFWSPDSKSVGFFSGDRLKRMDVSGGIATTVCAVPTGVGLFGAWGPTGDALFASIEGDAIFRVSMAGGDPVAVLKPDQSKGEVRVVFPSFLPDGERFLYTSHDRDRAGRVMLARPGQPSELVLQALSNVKFVPPGFLVFAREGALFAVPFDATLGRTTGEPIALGEPVRYMFGPGRATFSASDNGVLAIQQAADESTLSWVDRQGRESVIAGPGDYLRTRISAAGDQALFDRARPGLGALDLYSIDLVRGVERRLTSGPEPEGAGTWLPGGRSAFFAVARGGPPRIYRKDLVTGVEEPVLPQRGLQEPEDVSPDGGYLLYSERDKGEYDLWALPLSGDQTPVPVIRAPFNQEDARFSPDGRSVTFVSTESGRSEVYVAPFPKSEAPVRVSAAGGRLPRWSRDGHQLFYITEAQELVSVAVRPGQTGEIGASSRVFPANPVVRWQEFDVAPDGRFLAIVIRSLSGDQPLTVRTNWTSAITR